MQAPHRGGTSAGRSRSHPLHRLQAPGGAGALSLAHPVRIKWLLAFAAAAAVIALDLLTKRLVQAYLGEGHVYELLPFLSLERASNEGVAFGLLHGRSTLILVARLIALALVGVYLTLESRPIIAGIAGGLLIGGSLGNLVERVVSGHVTDFIRFPHWPNFNFADICIVAGVILVGISLLWPGGGGQRADKAPQA